MKITHTVIYDGDCKVCGRIVKVLTKWDRNHDLEIIPSQTPGVRERFPWIPPRAYVDSMQVVRASDGKTWQAAAALEELLNVLPKGRFISWTFRIPFMRPLVDRFYRWFARNRYRLGCGEHCAVRNLSVLFCLCLAALMALGCVSEPDSQSPAVSAQSVMTVRDSFEVERDAMVDQQIRARGIKAPAVLKAMRKVPRHRFVPANVRHVAYNDHALPIGSGQTISQPYIVAYMTEAADISPGENVLEIGTGSGYQAAILGEVAREVYTIEIIPELAEGARNTLVELGYSNVHAKTGNGYLGWPEHAPFDAILVTAAPDQVPQALVDQLALGGKMVVPVGEIIQNMMIIEKTRNGVVQRRTIPVRFVPMTGKPPEQ